MPEIEIRYAFEDNFDSILERANSIKMARDFVNQKYGDGFVKSEFFFEGNVIQTYIKDEVTFINNLFADYFDWEFDKGNLFNFIKKGLNRSRLELFSKGNNSVVVCYPRSLSFDEIFNKHRCKLKKVLFRIYNCHDRVVPL